MLDEKWMREREDRLDREMRERQNWLDADAKARRVFLIIIAACAGFDVGLMVFLALT